MCGIVCAFDLKLESKEFRPQLLEMSKKIRHRGPDWSGVFSDDRAIISHERLAIVDPQSGDQPLYSNDGNLVLAVNGEIYNHKDLKKELKTPYEFQTESDCEVILPLYQERGLDMFDDLNGIFGFSIYNKETGEYIVARDHMGIIPLYIGWDQHGQFFVA
ncbi:MAG: asparagine synthase B, partial [Ichthyobacteriaceae bacterium]|nr:asparagine synthase B [Ichthyobacteriaceae bacterium]